MSEEEKGLQKVGDEIKSLKRIPQDEIIGGVCSGVAYRLGAPTWLVRMGWFVATFCYGFGLGLYLLLWIFLPQTKKLPADYAARTGSDA